MLKTSRTLRALSLVIIAVLVATFLVAIPSAPPAHGATSTTSTVIRHEHTSSRFSRTPASLEKTLDRLMAHSDVVTVTEVGKKSRAAAVKEKGWTRIRFDGGAKGESAIAVRTSVWKVLYSKPLFLTTQKWKGPNGGNMPNQYAPTAVIQNRVTGVKVLVSVSHMPSHVEYGNGWRPGVPERVKAYKTAVKNWNAKLKVLTKRYNPDVRMITADWNLDLKKKWVRQKLRAWFPGLRPIPTSPYPSRGTLGKRLIDFTLASGAKRDGKVYVYPSTASSDHRPFRERLKH